MVVDENKVQEETGGESAVKESKESKNKWFVLRILSGKEKKVKEYIDFEVTRSEWGKIIHQVLIPTEKVFKIKAGKKITKEKNFFPGYILIEANESGLSKEILETIHSITGVVSFLSDTSKKPIPLRKGEINRILGQVDEMQESGETISEPYLVGESVKIIDGPFNNFNGLIEEVYAEKKKVKVMVKIFGRRTPVELNFMQVERQT